MTKELRPDLVHGFIPLTVASHTIKLPKVSSKLVAQFGDRITC